MFQETLIHLSSWKKRQVKEMERFSFFLVMMRMRMMSFYCHHDDYHGDDVLVLVDLRRV